VSIITVTDKLSETVTMTIDINPREQRWASISATARRGPLARSSLYELAGKHSRLFRKFGRKTVVDLDLYDRILEDLPFATVKKSA
jgi:hypothetical protein